MESHKHRPRLYVAAPLFCAAELEFNKQVRDALSGAFDVYLPQEDGGLLREMLEDGVSLEEGGRLVFERDIEALRSSDFLLISLDGRTVDEGAAFELGFAHALGKPCYGLQTDARRLLPIGNNPMLEGALQQVFSSLEELHAWAQSAGDTVRKQN
ncbi:MAG: nucleoside 2-deoxyribosyltransferase [Anaerolineae bacterium]|nr:nucleoside 2-deoxyribosyltransferase [Gemmatimonadaceae bacterium]